LTLILPRQARGKRRLRQTRVAIKLTINAEANSFPGAEMVVHAITNWHACHGGLTAIARRARAIGIPLSACILLLFAGASPAQSQAFRVGNISVCYNKTTNLGSCSQVDPPFENLKRSRFANRRLYVLLTVICESNALSFLTDNGYLPVNVAVWKDGNRKKGDIPIGIKQDDWDDDEMKLKGVVATEGSFPWRTHFNVSVSDAKSIQMEITDGQRNVVYREREPARFTLTFER
jgi:hypothetical protein